VLACVSNSYALESGKYVCGFNAHDSSCHYSTGLGVFAFLTAFVFVVIEAQWEKLGSYHRWIYNGERIVSAVLAFLFFVGFCILASGWSNTNASLKDLVSHGNAYVAIISSLFSVFSWGALAYFSHKGYKEDDFVGGGMERLGGGYLDPVTSSYHQGSTV
jgi:Membrane-associating domain